MEKLKRSRTIMLIIPSENQEQRALVKWVKLQPKLREFIMKLDNEGKRTPGQGWNAKLMGLLPGASDLFLAYPSGGYCGCWIECKRNKKYTPSQMKTESWINQEIFQNNMKSVGFHAFFAFGLMDGINKILEYLDDKPS